MTNEQENAEMARIEAQYPTLNDSDFEMACQNAIECPCEGSTFLELYAASCSGFAEAK